jgi:hypothetical protein
LVASSLHGLAHLKAMLLVLALGLVIAAEFALPHVLYPLAAVPLGGLAGGLVFGTYLVLTGLFAQMHSSDAFGALGIRDHKNFLRMKFDEHKLTIYPIGVARLPSTRACNRELKRNPPTVDSSMLPNLRREIEPFLIPWRVGRKHIVQPIVLPRVPQAAVMRIGTTH